ncbi:MAG TPA: hypothetical protein VFL55_07740 [Acetobacteraceae bacterium]|nr:hypothetical protein [Acetobacteraceae bacterium]
MRRIALTCLCLALSGCGYNTWWNPPFTTGTNPNMPVGNSENMRRVIGDEVETPVLTPEPGDIWPGPLKPEPTLQELEQQGTQSAPERPVPGSPDFRNQQQPPPNLPPIPPQSRGSSTPPGSNQPGLSALPGPTPPRPTDTSPPGRNPAGQVVPTQQGPGVSTGGTSGYQTLTNPGGGGSSIIVPNGNGTSTIIHPDGKIETVPTPR